MALTPDEYRNDLQARKAFLQERNRQMRLSRQLRELGLLTDPNDISFLGKTERQTIYDLARHSRLQTEWIPSTWEEIRVELGEWLSQKGKVLDSLNEVVADGTWFAARLQELQTLWNDLYFYALDGMSAYLVSDSERGFEKLVWRAE